MSTVDNTPSDLTDVPPELHGEVLKWRTVERLRPEHIVLAGPGQESVWDYPRPPRVEPVSATITVVFHGLTLASSQNAYRVIETSGAPVYYIPQSDINMECLEPSDRQTLCEWKGTSAYFNVNVNNHTAADAAWTYPQAWGEFAVISGYIAFHPAQMSECWVNQELARPQPGNYYGGWVTDAIVGPFKGEPGSEGW